MTNLKFPIELAQRYHDEFTALVEQYGAEVWKQREYWDWYQKMLDHFGSFNLFFHFLHYRGDNE